MVIPVGDETARWGTNAACCSSRRPYKSAVAAEIFVALETIDDALQGRAFEPRIIVGEHLIEGQRRPGVATHRHTLAGADVLPLERQVGAGQKISGRVIVARIDKHELHSQTSGDLDLQ